MKTRRRRENETRRQLSREATFPPDIVIRRQQSKKTREGNRENGPNRGKGWAQQPEALCRGQLHKITSEREKQGAAETERGRQLKLSTEYLGTTLL